MTILNNGYVGVGTNAPAVKFEVSDTINSGNSFRVRNLSSDVSAYAEFSIMNDGTSNFQLQNFGTAYTGTWSGIPLASLGRFRTSSASSGLVITTGGGDPLIFGTTDIERMRIDPSGYVGIGTTTPNNLLQVNDLISFNNTDVKTQIGYQAGKYDLGQYNTWIGYQSGSANNATGKDNTADNNTAIGYRSLYSNTTGYYNTANGSLALTLNTTGFANTATGWSTLGANLTGTYNTATGYNSMVTNDSGSLNAAYGGASLRWSPAGWSHVPAAHSRASPRPAGTRRRPPR